MVENPRTYWTHFYGSQALGVLPFFFGEDRQKTTNMFIRGTSERIPWTNNLRNGSTTWRSVRLADEEQTNQFRCRLLPGMAAAIADHLPTKGNEPRPLVLTTRKCSRRWLEFGLVTGFLCRCTTTLPTLPRQTRALAHTSKCASEVMVALWRVQMHLRLSFRLMVLARAPGAYCRSCH